jgi:hypothetical protein
MRHLSLGEIRPCSEPEGYSGRTDVVAIVHHGIVIRSR